MQSGFNTYWPVYQRLEHEVLKLANVILFNDEQINIYSPYIGELIVRCAIEIETLSKDLYNKICRENSMKIKNRPYFDKDCIGLLIDKWKIDKKKIQITNINMFFSKGKSVLTPLKNAHEKQEKGSEWKQAYQGIKHNRSQEIKVATINNLLNALGALYILNIYYKNDSYWDNVPINDRKPYANDSAIFSPMIYDASKSIFQEQETVEQIEESIYIKKLLDENMQKIRAALFEANHRTTLEVCLSKNNIKNHILGKNIHQDMYSIANECGIDISREFVKNVRSDKSTANFFMETEIVLNHGTPIYQCQSYEEFLASDKAREISKEYEVNATKSANDVLADIQNKSDVL